MSLLLVMAGGAIGAGGRFLVGRAFAGSALPYATLIVNLAGGLLMGLLAGALLRGLGGESLRLFAGVGVLGGFTTFSAFSLEIVDLAARGAVALAAGYAFLSVLGSAAALFAGFQLARVWP
jgi:CrcB protein